MKGRTKGLATLSQVLLVGIPSCQRDFIMKYTTVTEDVILVSWLHILGVSNRYNDVLLTKEGKYYMLFIIHDHT